LDRRTGGFMAQFSREAAAVENQRRSLVLGQLSF
jgi:hypothetical protein